jgi:hypothetical protein
MSHALSHVNEVHMASPTHVGWTPTSGLLRASVVNPLPLRPTEGPALGRQTVGHGLSSVCAAQAEIKLKRPPISELSTRYIRSPGPTSVGVLTNFTLCLPQLRPERFVNRVSRSK